MARRQSLAGCGHTGALSKTDVKRGSMIAAILLAAGMSRRMGQPKMLLPWGRTTVIEQVISMLMMAGIDDILVITGRYKEAIEEVIAKYPIQVVHNEKYTEGEMLSSLQCGLRELKAEAKATLVVLGDQPQVQVGSVRLVCDAFLETKSNIVAPSYQMRRGHPWLVARPLWDELLKMKSPQTPRDFLNAHKNEIHYVNTDDPNVLADLDTPSDYRKWQP